MNSPYQIDAFLAYWLSYFVFLNFPENGLHSFVFSMAVLLARGKRLLLALFFWVPFMHVWTSARMMWSSWSGGMTW